MKNTLTENDGGIGTKRIEYISNETFCDNVRVRLPVLIAEGVRQGPTLFMCAAQHGRELHGVAALSSAFEDLNPDELSGRVVMMPVMNPLGLRIRSQDFPNELKRYSSTMATYCGHNMEVLWGNEEDTPTTFQRLLTTAVYETYVKSATAVLDIHGWRSGSAVLADDSMLSKALALGFRLNVPRNRRTPVTTLCRRALAEGKDAFIVEIRPQDYLEAGSVIQGRRMVSNMLKAYDMLPGRLELPDEQFIIRDNVFVKAPVAGLVVPLFADQEMVPAGSEYLRILSLDTGETIWRYHAPETLMNIYSARYYIAEGREATSMVEPGMLIGHLAKVDKQIN